MGNEVKAKAAESYNYRIPEALKNGECGNFVPGTEVQMRDPNTNEVVKFAISVDDLNYFARLDQGGDAGVLSGREAIRLLENYKARLREFVPISGASRNPIFDYNESTSFNSLLVALNHAANCEAPSDGSEGIKEVPPKGAIAITNEINDLWELIIEENKITTFSLVGIGVGGLVGGLALIGIGAKVVAGAVGAYIAGVGGALVVMGGIALVPVAVVGIVSLSIYLSYKYGEHSTLKVVDSAKHKENYINNDNCSVKEGCKTNNRTHSELDIEYSADLVEQALRTYCGKNYESLNPEDQAICDEN